MTERIGAGRGLNFAFASLIAVLAFPAVGTLEENETDAPLTADQLREDPRVIEAVALLVTWVEAQRAYSRIPGISMGIVYDQDLLWGDGFGYADLESERQAETSTIYSICSISKLFTSIGVMQLRDQGKLRLDDPIQRHIPWFKINENHDSFGPATVESILSHSSGLPRETGHPYWSGPDFPFPTREEIIDQITSQNTLYPTSSFYQYSNLGLTLAGELIVQTTGMTYEDYVRQGILEPLALQDTTPQLPKDQIGSRLATGYGVLDREGKRPKMPFFQARGIAPAAGYASTVEDLGKFASWQLRVLAGQENKVLGRNTLREMQRVHWLDSDWYPGSHRGLGFSIWRDDGRTFVGHGGSCPGYRTHLSLDTKRKVAAVFMTNGMGTNVRAYTRRAHEIVGGALADAIKSPKEAKVVDPTFAQYVGLYRGSWGEAAVLTWKGDLSILYLPTTDPLDALVKLKKIDTHIFRRVRDDDELGEEIRFEVGDQGQIVRMTRHGNYMARVR